MKIPTNNEDWLSLYASLKSIPGFEKLILNLATERFSVEAHGDFSKWASVIESLPEIKNLSYSIDTPTVLVHAKEPLAEQVSIQLKDKLQQLHPWRKGPFDILGNYIDTEWRSDWKWARLESAISPLYGRKVLDIGTGSGYHIWRMMGAGAHLAIGIEPMLLYVMQFLALKHFIPLPNAHVFPIGIEDMPKECIHYFDTIFSMGVLYHRKNPLEHLEQIKSWLSPHGELVLETLIIEGDEHSLLIPESRYAQMRNVWFLPSVAMLKLWLKRLGFVNICVIDISTTSLHEQRSTPWMRFDSLKNFLDPNDSQKTIEGYPAPRRAIITAQKP